MRQFSDHREGDERYTSSIKRKWVDSCLRVFCFCFFSLAKVHGTVTSFDKLQWSFTEKTGAYVKNMEVLLEKIDVFAAACCPQTIISKKTLIDY